MILNLLKEFNKQRLNRKKVQKKEKKNYLLNLQKEEKENQIWQTIRKNLITEKIRILKENK
jgi:hypothetical protein